MRLCPAQRLRGSHVRRAKDGPLPPQPPEPGRMLRGLNRDQHREFRPNLPRGLRRDGGPDRVNWAGLNVDAAQMAEQDFAGDRQSIRQDDAGGKRPDPGRNRADKYKSGVQNKRPWRERERRTPAGLLTTERRIEIGPDEVAGFRQKLRPRSFLNVLAALILTPIVTSAVERAPVSRRLAGKHRFRR